MWLLLQIVQADFEDEDDSLVLRVRLVKSGQIYQKPKPKPASPPALKTKAKVSTNQAVVIFLSLDITSKKKISDSSVAWSKKN